MTFPRAAAVAETAWSPKERKNFLDFQKRLIDQFSRYSTLGINFADSLTQVAIKAEKTNAENAIISLEKQANIGEIYYSIDANAKQYKYTAPFEVKLPASLTAVTILDGQSLSQPSNLTLNAARLATRYNNELTLCETNLPLRLEDDAPVSGERKFFNVDILKSLLDL